MTSSPFDQAGTTVEIRKQWLSGLTPDQVRELAPRVPGWLEAETVSEVAADLISRFGRVWPRDHLQAVSARLLSPSLAVRVAALEILCQLAPQALLEHLPRFLVATEPRLRTLAIRGLAAIDEAEARAHIDYLLNSEDPAERKAGIQAAFFLPFEQVKPLALRFASVVTDPTELEAIATLLTGNPDPEVPLRLYEMVAQSRGAKAAWLKGLIQEVCQAIQGSDILGSRFPEYRRRLQHWLKEKETARFVQAALQGLSGDIPEVVRDAEAAIARQLPRPPFRQAFQEALQWPLGPEVRARLERLLEEATTEASQPLSPGSPVREATRESAPVVGPIRESLTPEAFAALAPDQRVEVMAGWEPTEAARVIPLLEGWLGAVRPTSGELATALLTARRLGFAGLRDRAIIVLQGKDPGVATAALEYLGDLDPEAAFPHLGSFLQSPNLRMKSAAIRIMNRFDPAQALSNLRVMLASKDLQDQRMALACMAHLDFSVVRPLLVDFLGRVPEATLVMTGLCFFVANPEPDNLYDLYFLEHLLPGPLKSEAFSVRRKVEAVLRETDRLPFDRATLDQHLESRWQEAHRRRSVPPPAYSVRSLKAAGLLAPSPGEASLSPAVAGTLAAVGWLIRHSLQLVFVFLLVLAAISYSWLQTVLRPGRQEVVIGSPLDLEGRVTRSPAPDQVEIRSDRFGVFEVRIPPGSSWRPKPGETFRGTVLPLRVVYDRTAAELQRRTPATFPGPIDHSP
ncbi:MAG: HEAT repeat domain-containing protein [Candidatus Riflebacteria bacterium]|nr:HEAT repeat domain-containing protein [Candidatus Riflebacteria bacterium]